MEIKTLLYTLLCIVLVAIIWKMVSVQEPRTTENDSLSYCYFDEIAQSYCASKAAGWVFAIRRNCNGEAPTCNDMCNSAKQEILKSVNPQRNSVSCFDAFHILKGHPVLKANPSHTQPDAGKFNLGTYGYGSGGCTWTSNNCGPNYTVAVEPIQWTFPTYTDTDRGMLTAD